MSGGRRGGERRRACARSPCTRRAHEESCIRSGDASFARSFDPCASILTMHEALKKGAPVVRRSDRYHGWANPREREEPALGPDGWTLAARRVSPLPRGRGRGTSEKEGGRGLRPCEDSRARVRARTSCSVAEVGRRPLASNKLGNRAPKRRQGRVNGGLARCEGRRVKPSAGASSEGKVASRTHPRK